MTARTQPTSTTGVDAAPDVFDYLVVDEFLRGLTGSRALKSALELGVIDTLSRGSRQLADLSTDVGADAAGITLLTNLLVTNGVIEISAATVQLTPRFAHALQYRELLERKLDFIGFVLLDFVDHFNSLIVDPAKFMRDVQLFRLFDYRRAADMSEENYAWTKVWIRLTTALTRHEADVCLHLHDFSRYDRMLDIGGNSGEFVLRACKAHAGLRASVMDLPVVCEFGQDHVLGEPENDRISFIPGSALDTPLPSGCDLVTFKSMLHDWPEAEARSFVQRAAEALEPGGTLLVFERAPLDFAAGQLPLSALPMLMFARSFRSPALYDETLAGLGFEGIETQTVDLDTPFFVLTARKPGG